MTLRSVGNAGNPCRARFVISSSDATNPLRAIIPGKFSLVKWQVQGYIPRRWLVFGPGEIRAFRLLAGRAIYRVRVV